MPTARLSYAGSACTRRRPGTRDFNQVQGGKQCTRSTPRTAGGAGYLAGPRFKATDRLRRAS